MAAGLQNKRIVFIIQARMQSARLPGKILLPIPLNAGKPLLLWIVQELKKSTHKATIVLATSVNKENDILESFAKEHKIACFRGDEENVLSRFTGILKGTAYDTVVRLTADNPIIDIDLLDRTVSYHLENDNAYTRTEALPVGMNFEIVKGSALLESERGTLTKQEEEHVTLFIRNNDNYRKGIFDPKLDSVLKELRLTVDYPSDFLVVATLLAFYETYKTLRGVSLVAKVLKDFPLVFKANRDNFQKKQFSDLGAEVGHAITILEDLELNNAALLLSKYEKENSI